MYMHSHTPLDTLKQREKRKSGKFYSKHVDIILCKVRTEKNHCRLSFSFFCSVAHLYSRFVFSWFFTGKEISISSIASHFRSIERGGNYFSIIKAIHFSLFRVLSRRCVKMILEWSEEKNVPTHKILRKVFVFLDI
jgi:hypothetical protein